MRAKVVRVRRRSTWRRAVRWDAGSATPVELGSLSHGITGVSVFSQANAINNAGVIVGDSSKFDPTGTSLGRRPVVWAAGSTTPTELGVLSIDSKGSGYG